MVGVCFDGPLEHLLGLVVVALDGLEEDGVGAEVVGVVGVCFDGPLEHGLGLVVVAPDVCEKESVKAE